MRTIERHGRDDVRAVFTDTGIEDPDLYRFLDDSEKQLGIEILRLADGRTPWQVFRDRRMIGNTRADLCSRILKREVSQKWLAANAPGATLVFGIDWEELHRVEPLTRRYGEQGYAVECPMTESPWKSKYDVLAWMRSEGLEPPRLYAMGAAHNNCGGFCVRAGHGHFAWLLDTMPDVFARHEQAEQELREYLGKDVSILRDRKTVKVDPPQVKIDEDTGEQIFVTKTVVTRPLTLREFRERKLAKALTDLDLLDTGGCGCFVDAA